MRLARLLDESPDLSLSLAGSDLAGVEVSSVAYDSRSVAPGALFAASAG